MLRENMVGLTIEQVRLASAAMYSSGMPIAEVASFLKVTPYIVSSAISRLVNTGSVIDRPRSGRPRKHTDRDDRSVKYQVMRSATFSAAKLSREKMFHRRAVSQILRSSRFRRYSDRSIPFVTERWKNMRRELYLNLKEYDWVNVIYTDEKTFQFHSDGRVKIYARSPQEYMRLRGNVGYDDRLTVRVWGAISSRGTGQLIFLEPPWNAEAYVTQVLAVVFASGRSLRRLLHTTGYVPKVWHFQQDNDARHKAPAAMNFLSLHGVKLVRWPPRSPDWSPIENVWSVMIRKIREQQLREGGHWNKEDMKRAIMEAWQSITRAMCKKLCYSVPNRIRESKANGWMSVYNL